MRKTEALFDPEALQRVKVAPIAIEITGGPEAGRALTIKRRTVLVGSDPDADISLDDPSVSRRHAEIEQASDGVRVRDLGSTNGTYVNDLRVESAWLPLPGRLRLGSSELSLSAADGAVEVDLYRGEKLAGMVGQSPAMQEVFGLLARVAPTDVTVLVTGESGTGKELVARGLHELSARSDGPMVVFDCSAVPRELIESELFGHVKGAFTGAQADRAGAFRQAHKGTLFLDEIGELALDLQPRLLRALEHREIKPVGSGRTHQVDVRIVAATNRPLRTMVDEGGFREDLFYRFAQIEVRLPPLRERPTDIPLLVESFLDDLRQRGAIPDGAAVQVGWSVMERLKAHPWPGNIRELRNYVQRAALLSSDGRIESQYLVPPEAERRAPSAAGDGGAADGLDLRFDLPFKDAKARLVEAFERSYWTRMLEAHHWNVSAAARAAGIHRKSLEYVVRKLDLKGER